MQVSKRLVSASPSASRLCLLCQQNVSLHLFKIAELVCDRCIAQRELERRARLGHKHPDLEGRHDVHHKDFQYVPGLKAARKIVRYWLVESDFRGDNLQPQFQYDPEMIDEIRAERSGSAAPRRSVRD